MSTKLTIKEAVEVIPVSESSLRRDIKSGKVSAEVPLESVQHYRYPKFDLQTEFQQKHGVVPPYCSFAIRIQHKLLN